MAPSEAFSERKATNLTDLKELTAQELLDEYDATCLELNGLLVGDPTIPGIKEHRDAVAEEYRSRPQPGPLTGAGIRTRRVL